MKDPLIIAEEHYRRCYNAVVDNDKELQIVHAMYADLLERKRRLSAEERNAWGEREMAKAKRNKLVRDGLLAVSD